MADEVRVGWPKRIVRLLDEHPVLLVTIVASAFVAFQWWWIANARFLGSLDVDEAGSIATSLRFHRALATGPSDLIRAASETGSGPLVPLLSIPFIVVFGRSAISPMFVQPVLVMLSAIGVTGAVYQLVGRRAAVVAGCCTLAMPALIVSSRTDQFSNGVGAAMCLGVWALLASDRGRKPWPVFAFGVACGAMTISRTMSVSFLPAMAAGAIVVAAMGERLVRRNLALAAVGASAVAIPWWWAQWDYVSSYLMSSGYGDRSGFFGPEMVIHRIVMHFAYLLQDFRALLPLGFAFTVLIGIRGVHGMLRSPRSWFNHNRGLIAVWAVIALGTLALLSSSNRGVWFATPLDSLLVVGVVAAGTRLLRSEERIKRGHVVTAALVATLVTGMAWGIIRIGVGVGLVVMVVASIALVSIRSRHVIALGMGSLALGVSVGAIAASVPLVGPSSGFPDSSLRGQLFGGLEPYLPTIHKVDPRLSSRDIHTRRQVAAEWSDAARRLDRELLDLEEKFSIGGSGLLEVTVTGSRGLFDVNTIAVARELGPRGVQWMVAPNTYGTTDEEVLESLTPRAWEGTPRVIVAIEGRSPPFPDSLGWHRLVRLARREGWVLHSVIPLPDRGRVAIYTHPSNLPGG